MTKPLDLADAIIAGWKTNNRVTMFLFENLPSELWATTVPGTDRRTVRMIAGHIHNIRCMWIKMLGRGQGIRAPKSVPSEITAGLWQWTKRAKEAQARRG